MFQWGRFLQACPLSHPQGEKLNNLFVLSSDSIFIIKLRFCVFAKMKWVPLTDLRIDQIKLNSNKTIDMVVNNFTPDTSSLISIEIFWRI